MPNGFGSADYVVVAASLLFTAYALSYRPRLMLYALPTLLTIYFFVPLVTLLTPWQVVPLMLGVWLVINGRLTPPTRFQGWVIILVLAVVIALIIALFEGDAWKRPIMRALHYISLIFLFTFTILLVRADGGLRAAMWGLAVAGAIHAGYALYQLLAFEVGLPFRAIVRGLDGGYDIALFSGTLRVNGLASEPKRLGYVLFAAMLASIYLASTTPSLGTRSLLRMLAGVCFLVSLMTLSGSYFATLALMIVIFGLISPRFIKLMVVMGLPILGIATISPDATTEMLERIDSMVSTRYDEIETGLDSERVYRQDFFAQDYVASKPSVVLTGVGLGRYNRVLNETYGPGVGYAVDGSILPLNSQFYEILLDLGLLGLVVWFIGAAMVALAVGQKSQVGFTLFAILTFLIIQSISIANLPLSTFVLGTCCSYLLVRYGEQVRRPALAARALTRPPPASASLRRYPYRKGGYSD